MALESLEAAEHLAQEKEAQKLRKAWEDDEAALRTQRMGLRDIATQLLCNRQWKEFWEPVDPKEDPDYYERVKYLFNIIESPEIIQIEMRNAF